MRTIPLLLFLISTQLFSQQELDITGEVKEITGAPISFANVVLEGSNKYAITDENGKFKITNIDAGTYNITISFIGFTSFKKTIDLNENVKLSVTLREGAEALEGVTLFAESQEQRQSAKALTINSLDVKKLQNQALGVESVIKQSTGVVVRQSGGLGSQVNINLNGLTGQAVRTYYDGMPLELYGGAFQINDIPVDILSRVDIYKGVMPVGIGTDALGGGINLVSFERSEDYARISYSFGSFNTHRVTVNGNHNFNDNIAISLQSFVNYTDNDYLMRDIPNFVENLRSDGTVASISEERIDARRFHDRFRSSFVKGALRFTDIVVADELEASLIASRRDNQIQNGTFITGLAVGEAERENEAFIGEVKYRKRFFDNLLDLKYHGLFSRIDNKVTDSTTALYNWRGQQLITQNDVGSEISGVPTQREGEDEGTAHRLTLRINLTDDININISEFNNKYVIQGNDPIGARIALGDEMIDPNTIPSTLQSNIIGAETTFKFFDKRLTVFGLFKNYDYSAESIQFNNTSGVTTIPLRTVNSNDNGYGGGFKYQINPKLFVRSSYEKTIRFPTQGEVFGDFAAIIPNFELRPERSNNYNVGIRYTNQFNDSKALKVDLGFFFRDQEDLIRTIPFGPENSQFVNEAFVESIGVEVSSSYTWKNLFLNGNLTIQKLEIAEANSVSSVSFEGSPVPNIPTTFANLSARYKFDSVFNSNNEFDIAWNYFFVDVFGFIPLESLDAATSINSIPRQHLNNVNVTYTMPRQKLIFSLGVQNVFNQEVFDNFSVPRPGTNYNFKINYSF